MNQKGLLCSIRERPEWIPAILAFLVRFWFLTQLMASPFFEPITNGNDRALYDGLALRMAGGSWFPPGVFEYMPLYPWVLSRVYAVMGPNLFAVGILGALMDSATTFLIVRLARHFKANLAAALLAGCLYALFPTAIVYSVMTMPNTLNAFLLICFCACALKLPLSEAAPVGSDGRKFHPLMPWFGLGLLAGITTLGFAGMLLVAVVCLVLWTIQRLRNGIRSPLPLGVFILGMILPILPVTIHNWCAEGSFVLVTAHGGFNFYMGNHENANGYPVQIQGFRGDAGSLLADARAEAERIRGRHLGAAEFSKFWSDRAWQFIRSHPGDEIQLIGLKVLKFWNRLDYDDMRFLPMFRITGLGFTSPLWPGFAWLAWIGFCGLFLARGCGVVRAVTASGLFGVLSFFITARYRLNFAPLLGILGALGISELIRLFRAGAAVPLWRRGMALMVVIVATLMVAWPIRTSDFRALDHFNTAAYLVACKRPAIAVEVARRGLEIAPQNADLYFVMGNGFLASGRMGEAVTAYEKAIYWQRDYASAHYNLGHTLLLLKQPAAALKEAGLALVYDPRHPSAAKLMEEAQAELNKKSGMGPLR